MKIHHYTTHTLVTLIAIFVLAVLVRMICFVGLIGSDDLSYNRAAYALSDETALSQMDHQTSRLGLLLPVAQTFNLFGVNEISSILFPFLCFIILYWTLVLTATTFLGKWTGIMAGVLYTFLPIEMFHATMLLPDLPSAAFIALSGSVLYWDQQQADTLSPTKRACLLFLAGVLLGWAYLIRITALFFGVFVAGYAGWQSATNRKIQWRWLWFGGGFLLVLLLESGYYSWMTGNPLHRYIAIGPGISSSLVLARRRLEGIELLSRLTRDLFSLLFLEITDYSFYYFFVFAGMIHAFQQKHRASLMYFIGWFLTILVCFNFATRRFSEYIPLRLVPRYYVTLSFPAILIIAWYLSQMRDFLHHEQLFALRDYRFSLGIPFLLLCVLNACQFSIITTLFLGGMGCLLLLTCWEAGHHWLRSRLPSRYREFFLPLLLLYILIVPGIYMSAKGERPRKGIGCERNIRPLLGFPLSHPIYTDERTEEILEYFYEYQYDDNIHAFCEGQADCSTPQSWPTAYMVANWERIFFLHRVYRSPIPLFLYAPPSTWKLYKRVEGSSKPCVIYEIP